MTVTINGTTGITNDGGYTGDGVVFADTTPSNTLVTTTGGNVGIGTSSPATKLHVNGKVTATGIATAADTAITLELNSGTAFNTGGAAIALRGSTVGYNNNGMEFYAGNTERMRIDSSGNVGIGTSSPAGKLHTVGSSGVYSLITQAPSTAGTYYHQLFKNDSTDIAYASSGGSVFAINTVGATPLVFGVNAIERARIDSSGSLLVGTTSFRGAGTASITFFQWNSNTTNTGFEARARFATNGTDVGFISTDGSGTTYSTSSDYRLKNTIAPMTGALAKVALLKPCTYKWNADGSDGQGFIAHELAEVVPDAVVGEKDAVDAEGNPQYQGIDTSFLVATLTAAIQEQQAIITALTARVEALEGTKP